MQKHMWKETTESSVIADIKDPILNVRAFVIYV